MESGAIGARTGEGQRRWESGGIDEMLEGMAVSSSSYGSR